MSKVSSARDYQQSQRRRDAVQERQQLLSRQQHKRTEKHQVSRSPPSPPPPQLQSHAGHSEHHGSSGSGYAFCGRDCNWNGPCGSGGPGCGNGQMACGNFCPPLPCGVFPPFNPFSGPGLWPAGPLPNCSSTCPVYDSLGYGYDAWNSCGTWRGYGGLPVPIAPPIPAAPWITPVAPGPWYVPSHPSTMPGNNNFAFGP